MWAPRHEPEPVEKPKRAIVPVVKLFEIRDSGTMIPAMGILVSKANGPLVHRAGFGETPCVILVALTSAQSNYDPWQWGNRTMNVSHNYIIANWNTLQNGAMVDVQFILGETTAPKASEVGA